MRKDHDQYHTTGPEEQHATTTSTAHNFRVSLNQNVGKKTGVVSTSIEFEYTYSSELIEEILRIDLHNITSLREMFPGMDATSTIRTIPTHVLGFSTDWSAVLQKLQAFSVLSGEQQEVERQYHWQLPVFEKEMYVSNFRLLTEQHELLRSAAVPSMVAASNRHHP